jgi:preprotein translocase subunit YajC
VTASLLAVMAAPDMPGGGLSLLLFQIVAIGLVFYFLILRPQSQARKKHEELLKNIKKGDEVTTAGGIIGKVKDVKEDRVTIESGSATLVIERARIIRIGDSAPAPGAAG